jgi:hypothetical protein
MKRRVPQGEVDPGALYRRHFACNRSSFSMKLSKNLPLTPDAHHALAQPSGFQHLRSLSTSAWRWCPPWAHGKIHPIRRPSLGSFTRRSYLILHVMLGLESSGGLVGSRKGSAIGPGRSRHEPHLPAARCPDFVGAMIHQVPLSCTQYNNGPFFFLGKGVP